MKKIIAVFISLFIFAAVIVFASTDESEVLYLTFDDGPTHNTPFILDTLNKYNAKATFFVLEDRIKQYPEYMKRIVAEGHSVGLHGSSHDVNTIYSAASKPLEEMNSANQILYETLGFKTKLVRTPYGSHPYMNLEQYKILKAANYNLWDWTVDPRDGVGTPSFDTVISNIRTDLKGNDFPIVLLHDRKSTAKNLDAILNFFSEREYTFSVLTETMDPVNFMELYGPARKKH